MGVGVARGGCVVGDRPRGAASLPLPPATCLGLPDPRRACPPARPASQWLLDRPKAMKAAMLKPGGDGNAMLDTSVLPKLTAQGGKRLAGGRAGWAGWWGAGWLVSTGACSQPCAAGCAWMAGGSTHALAG